jgi:glucose uptake protein
MHAPHTFVAALVLTVVSMIGWGSWPNLLKALPKWRLEYFYVDYTLGFLASILIYSATFGSSDGFGLDFVRRLLDAGHRELLLAFVGGFVWNLGNVLLLYSIMMAGLAVAFPVASILALVLGVGISYWAHPIGNPEWLALSVVILAIAGNLNAASYRQMEHTSGVNKRKAITFALLAGVLVGAFPPFVGGALSGPRGLDSYSVSILFMVGAAVVTFTMIPTLLAYPLVGEKGTLTGYFQGPIIWHVLGWLAGLIWCSGTLSSFLSAGVVGVAISWGIGSGAPMVGALWGIFLWKEFSHARRGTQILMASSMVLYITGVILVAVSYARR